jgi:hypothetical protein
VSLKQDLICDDTLMNRFIKKLVVKGQSTSCLRILFVNKDTFPTKILCLLSFE